MSYSRSGKRAESTLRYNEQSEGEVVSRPVIDTRHLEEKAADERQREWQAMLDVSKVTDEMTEREVAVAVIGTAARLFDKGRRYPAPIKDDENFERLRTEIGFVFMDMVQEDINGDRPSEFWTLDGTGLVGTKCNWVGHGDCMMYMTGRMRAKRSAAEDYDKLMGK